MSRLTPWVHALLIASVPVAAAAQTATAGRAVASAAPRWEIEGYGGLGRFLDAGASTLSLPPAGAPITTSSPLFPSRRVSSWFFGDGASLLNAVNEQLGLTARITPLDAAIATIGRGAEAGTSVGSRLRVRTSPRVWTEIAVDVSSSSTSVPDSLNAAVEESRESFVAGMTSLFASGPFTGTSVTATTTPAGGSWREVAATLAANIELGEFAGFTSYATIGGGFVTRRGTQASVSVEGRYRTTILGSVPLDEIDRVTIRGISKNAPAVVAGTGLSRNVRNRLIIRLDARMIAANRTIVANLDATPSVATGTPADFIESGTNPSVQFSNNASTGRRSTLSGNALDRVEVARSTRLQARVLVTLGIGMRF